MLSPEACSDFYLGSSFDQVHNADFSKITAGYFLSGVIFTSGEPNLADRVLTRANLQQLWF